MNEYKLKLAKDNNYDILIIWENDYNTNREETLNKCINFLTDEKRN